MLVALALSAGCKTAEQKLLERSLDLNDRVFALLEEHVDAPDKAIRALTELEERSREERRALKAEFETTIAKLDPDAQKAFQEEARDRWEEYARKFQTIVKRFPPESQPRIRQLIGTITR